jgi:hypothetical protein
MLGLVRQVRAAVFQLRDAHPGRWDSSIPDSIPFSSASDPIEPTVPASGFRCPPRGPVSSDTRCSSARYPDRTMLFRAALASSVVASMGTVRPLINASALSAPSGTRSRSEGTGSRTPAPCSAGHTASSCKYFWQSRSTSASNFTSAGLFRRTSRAGFSILSVGGPSPPRDTGKADPGCKHQIRLASAVRTLSL